MRILLLSLLLGGAGATLLASAPVPGQTPQGVTPQSGESSLEGEKLTPDGNVPILDAPQVEAPQPVTPSANQPVNTPPVEATTESVEEYSPAARALAPRQPYVDESGGDPIDASLVPWSMVALSSVGLAFGSIWLVGIRRRLVARR